MPSVATLLTARKKSVSDWEGLNTSIRSGPGSGPGSIEYTGGQGNTGGSGIKSMVRTSISFDTSRWGRQFLSDEWSPVRKKVGLHHFHG
jgi:hypothetical protein